MLFLVVRTNRQAANENPRINMIVFNQHVKDRRVPKGRYQSILTKEAKPTADAVLWPGVEFWS